MGRVFNFSAGPSMLPEKVLKKASEQMLDYDGCGQSVTEMSHRSEEFKRIINEAERLLRELMNIPDSYKVLFLQGGASTQFSAIPLNFLNGSGKADYIITGQWSRKAYEEAKKYGDCKVAASSQDENFSCIPKTEENNFRSDADYVHICMNNTIYGTCYKEIPDTGGVPIVADASSCLLSEPIDVTKFGMIYAGAQKNIAPAGLTLAVIREDLIGNARDYCPTMLDYNVHAEHSSLYNTPPCYGIYMCMLVLRWLVSLGGLKSIAVINRKKAALLYGSLDNSEMFKGTALPQYRSLMNVPFITGSNELDLKFIAQASEAGFVNLKGHRTVGGMRASIYNAMPVEGVEALVEFMKKFEKENS